MTTDTLDSPAITSDSVASEVVDAGALATAGDAKLDLTKVSLADVAMAQFGDWSEQVKKAKATLNGLVMEMPTQAKVDEFKSLRQRLINVPRAEARRVAKDVKSKLSKTSKAVGEAEEQIVSAWDEAETLITPAIDKRQAELDEERARKAAGQAFRIALHNALIARINGYVESAQGLASERIAKGVEFVDGLTFGDECEEFKPQYEAAQQTTLATLRKMLADAQAAEAAEAQRMENERVARELAEQREALEKQAAELLAQRVAATHAIVFAFPEPEPVAAPISVDAPAAAASLVAANNAARAEIAASAAPAMAFLEEVAGLRTPQPASEPPMPAPPAPKPVAVHSQADSSAVITNGELCNRIGLGIIASSVIQGLGFTPVPVPKKVGVFWPEAQVPAIFDALIKHLQARKTLATKQSAEAVAA